MDHTSAPATDWVYDIETFADIFCVDLTHVQTRTRYIFEVSDRRDQSSAFVAFLWQLSRAGARMFGYNNEGFDWPVCQHLMQLGTFTAMDAHRKGTEIITGDRFAHTIWPSDRLVTQGDLFKIHHFDNVARSTSLKKLEINMRSHNVVDLPYPPDQSTTSAQKDEIIRYMCHDVSETFKFYLFSLDQIRFRDELAAKYPDMGDVLNMNDTKIGKKFFERQLGRDACYERVNGRRQPRQTRRSEIRLADVILPSVTFQEPEFQRVKDWLSKQVLRPGKDGLINTKGVFNDLSATVHGFTYDFGTGGIHGSVERQSVHEDDEYEIWDWDVASYYPNLAIANGLYPAHLSERFVEVYGDVYQMRKQHKKGTAENAMLKLALNGVYGDSNNKYGPFYDPQYTMSITVNGQLLLCMLAEWLAPGAVEMVQINTDGLTVRVHKAHVEWMKQVCKAWEGHTGLELESVRYAAMHIRDVNSYIAVKHDGGVKRIGAYAYKTVLEDPYTRERQWHQDHSALVVRKAAEANILHGTPVREFIQQHRDPFDFCYSVKVPRSSRLLWGDTQIQNTTRYIVTTTGQSLTKVMPPLKGSDQERHIGVEAGWTVTPVNSMDHFDWSLINWHYYAQEAQKLCLQ